MSSPTCSRSCTVQGFRPPTTSLRQRFVRWWWPAKPGVATGPGTAQELNRFWRAFCALAGNRAKTLSSNSPPYYALRSQSYSTSFPPRSLLEEPTFPHLFTDSQNVPTHRIRAEGDSLPAAGDGKH